MAKKSNNGTAAVAEIEQPTTQTAGALALAPIAPAPMLTRPVVGAAEAKGLWDEYVALCDAILDENDFTYYVHGRESDGKEIKPVAFGTRKAAGEQVEKLKAARCKDINIRERKKRSACDKLARFYNFTVPMNSVQLCAIDIREIGAWIVETRIGEGFSITIYQEGGTLKIVKATATVAVRAPSGRVEIGEAACAAAERRGGADSFAHADHDIPTTAFTRAKNRAILRSIGTGEVSAEEVEEAAPSGAIEVAAKPSVAPTPQPPKTTEQVSNVKAEPDGPQLQPHEAKTQTDPVATAEREAIKSENSETKKAAKNPPSMGNGAPVGGVPQSFVPPVGKTDGFEPLPRDAKFSERIAHAEKFIYGNAAVDTRRENQLIKYGIFLFPDMKADIEAVPGRLNMDKWNTEVRKIEAEQRKVRLHFVEQVLKMSGRDALQKTIASGVERLWGKV